jgi:hypothetical protein
MFTEQGYQKIFQQQGFIVLPLFGAEDLLFLEQLYNNSTDIVQEDRLFYTSIWSENAAYRQLIYDKVSRLFSGKLSKYLPDCEHIFSNLHIKKPGNDSSLLAHQDWNFVNEPEHQSMTVWCPLTDTVEHNGALQVIPGSHRMNNYVRGRFFDAPFKDIRETYIRENLMAVPMKAGEAIFFHSRLIHASLPNLSDETRVAASVVMVPKGTPVVHDVLNLKTSLVKRLNITPDFFYKYSCYDELANVPSENTSHYHFIPISPAELNKLCKEVI